MTEPIYYSRFSDFKVGMEVDNQAAGRCKVIEVRKERDRCKITFGPGKGQPIGYSCRGWVTVEYIGCQLDGSDEKIYQRCDAIVGISETDTPYKYTFTHSFREIGFDDTPWPGHVDSLRFIDKVRPGELCSSPHWEGTKHFKGKPPAIEIDSRDGSPICDDCWGDLMND